MPDFPVIFLGGISITEPITALTDLLLTILSFVLVARIKNRLHESFYNNAWRMFFLFIGISTALGVCTHGFSLYLGNTLFYILWMGMNATASLAVYFSLQATIRYTRVPNGTRALLTRINLGVLLCFLFLTLALNNFEIFKAHAVIGVLIIFVTYFAAWNRNLEGSGAVMLAFLLSILTVFVHTFQISMGVWFNYKDISHVMMMASLLLVYHGMHLTSRNVQLSWRRLKV
jgi:hypothetical protein